MVLMADQISSQLFVSIAHNYLPMNTFQTNSQPK